MADSSDNTLKILIQLGVLGKDDAAAFKDLMKETGQTADELAKSMGVINVSQEDVEKATKKATAAFSENHHEIKKVGNELGQAAGLGNVGSLAMGSIAVAALGAAKAIEFLRNTWEQIQETIKGPIEVGLPVDAPAHISAAASAWNSYAEARAKVIANSTGAEAVASAEEKKLANELSLIKQVLAAEKEKALADLALRKDQMTPEAYAAAQGTIGDIFGQAGTAADQKNRRSKIANKAIEATNLEIDARKKTGEALAIKAAPEEVAQNNQKTLDENAATAEEAKKDLKKRLALIDRFSRYKSGGEVVEYEGLGGSLAMLGESAQFKQRYGYYNDPVQAAADARIIEQQRLDQAEAQINAADSYRKRQSENSGKRKTLMDEAGSESGKAAVLRGEVSVRARRVPGTVARCALGFIQTEDCRAEKCRRGFVIARRWPRRKWRACGNSRA